MTVHSYENPEKYSKNNSLQYDFAMRVLSKSKIEKNSRVLDLGCGDGRVTYKLAELVDKGSVIGTDISETMITHATQTYQDRNNLRFMQMDTGKNFFLSQFDVVSSFNSLHWVKDQENALRGIANASVENGKVILLLSHKKSYYHYALDEVCASTKWEYYFADFSNPRSFFELNEYEEILTVSGLKIITLIESEMIYRFNSVSALKDFFSSSMINVKRIPSVLQDEFLDDFCKVFFKLLGSNDSDNIPVSFWCLDVSAIKSK